MRSVVLSAILIWLPGCARWPESYPPPAQRDSLPPLDDTDIDSFVEMNAVEAPLHLVKDISTQLSGGLWRWANRRPTLRLATPEAASFRFLMDFSIADDAFDTTGPVTLVFRIDGKAFDEVRYHKPGPQHYEKRVTPGLLRAGRIVTVEIEVDKVYRDKRGVEYGFVLIRAGFKP